MCSRRSVLTRPTSATEAASLADAVASVCERSFFAFVDGAGRSLEIAPAPPGGWYVASVAFEGPFRGRLRISMPAGLARDLFSAFVGRSHVEPIGEDELADMLAEFANMACGCWLTMQDRDDCFAVREPKVERAAAADAQGATILAVNDQPMLLALEPPGQP